MDSDEEFERYLKEQKSKKKKLVNDAKSVKPRKTKSISSSSDEELSPPNDSTFLSHHSSLVGSRATKTEKSKEVTENVVKTALTIEERVAQILRRTAEAKESMDEAAALETDDDEDYDSEGYDSFESDEGEGDSAQQSLAYMSGPLMSVKNEQSTMDSRAHNEKESDSSSSHRHRLDFFETIPATDIENAALPDAADDEPMFEDLADGKESDNINTMVGGHKDIRDSRMTSSVMNRGGDGNYSEEFEDEEVELNFYYEDEKEPSMGPAKAKDSPDNASENLQRLIDKSDDSYLNVRRTNNNTESSIPATHTPSKSIEERNVEYIEQYVEAIRIIEDEEHRGSVDTIRPYQPHDSSRTMSPPPPPPPLEEDSDEENSGFHISNRYGDNFIKSTVDSEAPNESKMQVQNPVLSVSPRNLREHSDASDDADTFRQASPSTSNEDFEIRQALQKSDTFLQQRTKHKIPDKVSVSQVRKSQTKEHELRLYLQQAQRQILELQQELHKDKIEVTESQNTIVSKSSSSLLQNARQTVLASPIQPNFEEDARVQQMHKEIEAQEHLIQAFQNENEQLMQKLKQMQRDTQYNVHLENQRLKSIIQERESSALRSSSQYSNLSKSTSNRVEQVPVSQYHAAVEARLRVEDNLSALQEDLASLKNFHHEKELEWKAELDDLKKSKRDLECKCEGINLEQIMQENEQIRALESQMEMERNQASAARRQVERKLEWYVSNQKLLDEQAHEIERLRARIQELEGNPSSAHTIQQGQSSQQPATKRQASYRSRVDIRRIHELEKQLCELQTALRKRNPDSITNMILATRQAQVKDISQQTVAECERKIQGMSKELESQRAAYERKLQTFRQQHDKLKLFSERQLRRASSEMEKSSLVQHAVHSRAQEEDKQMAHARAFYVEQMKENERKWKAKLQVMRRNMCGPPMPTYGHALNAEDNALGKAKKRIQFLENAIKKKEEELLAVREVANKEQQKLKNDLDQVRKELDEAAAAKARLAETFDSIHKARSVLQEEKKASDQTFESCGTQTDSVSVSEDLREAQYDELQSLTARLLSSENQRAAQQQEMEATFLRHQFQCQSLQSEICQLREDKNQYAAQASRITILENELLEAKEHIKLKKYELWPEVHLIDSLKQQIDVLSQKYQIREAELDFMLSQSKTSRELDYHRFRKLQEATVTAKNEEICRFKEQLEELLKELENLRNEPYV